MTECKPVGFNVTQILADKAQQLTGSASNITQSVEIQKIDLSLQKFACYCSSLEISAPVDAFLDFP